MNLSSLIPAALARKIVFVVACAMALASAGCGHTPTEEEAIRRDAAISRGHKTGLFEKDVHMTSGN